MYRMMLLNDGPEYDPVDSNILMTPFEPREGVIYRFRERGDTLKATRYKVNRIEIDQKWGDTANGVAWVYVAKME
jgi:hypothetical protein